jgi:chromosome segregation ATPase
MSLDGLESLEKRIREISGLVTDLRERNAELSGRVEELEAALAGAGQGGEESWQSERDELRVRLQTLVSTLEQLLDP